MSDSQNEEVKILEVDKPSEPPKTYVFDVFISHASEDKDDVVRPLAKLLEEKKLRVWYDEDILQVGDYLNSIFNGLEKSRFVIIVLSSHFFGEDKDWTFRELYKIRTLEKTKRSFILPIWHNVTENDIASFAPWLVNIVALKTKNSDIEYIANKLTLKIKSIVEKAPDVEKDSYEVFISHTSEDKDEYDIFIPHVFEDRDEFVKPLSIALGEQGLKVWYDDFTLNIEDSLRSKIDTGLSKSKFGIIIFSNCFFMKGWTNYEVEGLVTDVVTGKQILLPIWHKVTKQEVIDYSPSLANKVMRSTSTHTIHEIAGEIATLLKSKNNY